MAVVRRLGSSIYWVEFRFEGKRYRKSSGTTVRQKAREFEQRLRRQIHDEVKLGVVAYVPMRFDAAVKRYKTTHLNTKSRRIKSVQSNDYLLDRLIARVGAATLLHEITTPVVAKLKEDILDLGRTPATVNRYLANLRAILRMAHLEWGTLPQVPRFKLFRLNNERDRWLRESEEQRLLDTCRSTPHLHQLVTFLLDSGARLGEATDLRWYDVDLPKRGRATVRFLVTKSGKPRSVPLPKRTDLMLRELYADRPEGEDYVFLVRTVGGNWRGTIPQAKRFSNPHGAWTTAISRADLPGLRIHDLRHSYASRLVQRGVPLQTVSELLGHSSLRMSLRYAHLSTETLRHAVAKLD